MLPTATGTKVYVVTIITVISNFYVSLVETLNQMNSLKLKYHSGENFADLCDAILVYAVRLDISGAFMPKHLGYIIYIFEDNSDSIFHLWETHKYKDFMDFIKKLCVCD